MYRSTLIINIPIALTNVVEGVMLFNYPKTLSFIVITMVMWPSNGAPNPGVTVKININIDTNGNNDIQSQKELGASNGIDTKSIGTGIVKSLFLTNFTFLNYNDYVLLS